MFSLIQINTKVYNLIKGGKMEIKWFGLKGGEGSATLSSNSITLNSEAMVPFLSAYKTQVGLDEAGDLILRPLSKDDASRLCLQENQCFGIQLSKSYARINSRELLSSIAGELGLSLPKEGLKFKTSFCEKEGLLKILTGRRCG